MRLDADMCGLLLLLGGAALMFVAIWKYDKEQAGLTEAEEKALRDRR